MSRAELVFDGISIGFPNKSGQWTKVVDRVNLTVKSGERVGLIGESGSGKSLLALQATGVTPPPGRLLEGEVFSDTRPGLVMQEASSALNPVLTIGYQLREVIKSQTQHNPSSRGRRLLQMVGLDDVDSIMCAYPHQLSGGQAQRAFIALALAGDPTILIADEPTTGLDLITQAKILDLFNQLTDEHQIGLLLISHDLNVVGVLTERIYVMYGGMIVEQGPARDILREPMHPFTRLLAAPDEISTQRSAKPPVSGCRFAHRCSLKRDGCDQLRPELSRISADRIIRCPIVAGSRGAS